MKRGQWIKYIAVVLTFIVMAGFFWPGATTRVNATEVGEGGDTSMTSWSVVVSFNENGGEFSKETKTEHFPNGENVLGTFTTSSGADSIFSISIPENLVITREGYKLIGWMYNLDNNVYTSQDVIPESKYSDGNIVFTAVWEPLKSVTIIFDGNGGVISGHSEENVTEVEGEPSFQGTISDDIGVDREGYDFYGWLSSYDNGIYNSKNPQYLIEWETLNASSITFTAQWVWDGSTIIPNESLALTAGTPYTLSPGTWTVNGDDYSYVSSGNGLTFYVGSDGTYTFTKN